ncbi:hypothetical protein [Celeribacter sp. SCSIO 80788]|uniref:hypothetical protein n=1 Tax=Celeribacter sp. SCSIO 80788 TaxID=3117013 RepID=UPI003DA5B007
MDLLDFAAAVLIGNLLTLCVVWGFQQFNKHDYKAPWLAYAAFLMPTLFIISSVYLNTH